MATSLLALIDDIATVMDDVAVMTKIAAKKTTGVIGDDLALNAEQMTGISPERELPIIWKVCKGGLLNKVILVPIALIISSVAAFLILPMLMLGGLFLCFEGVEKVLEKFFPHGEEETAPTSEEEKIKGAIRTDFILSAEIIVIALGSVASAPLSVQVISLSVIAIAMTIGVYGLVAILIKLDDMGLALTKTKYKINQVIGQGLLSAAPKIMRLLGIVGTIAMFLVGGGIISHAISPIGHGIESFAKSLNSHIMIPLIGEALVGVLSGLMIVGVITLYKKIKGKNG